MALVSFEIDLDEIETHELIDELENRALCLSHTEKDQLLSIIRYRDSEKWKLFLSVMGKYSLMELQEMFNDIAPIKASKEQIPIPFD